MRRSWTTRTTRKSLAKAATIWTNLRPASSEFCHLKRSSTLYFVSARSGALVLSSDEHFLRRSLQRFVFVFRYYCFSSPLSPSFTSLFPLVRSPTLPKSICPGLPCLGEFGGPAMPNVIFGDYEYKDGAIDYLKAKMLAITFSVINHVDKAQNEKAKAWEKV